MSSRILLCIILTATVALGVPAVSIAAENVHSGHGLPSPGWAKRLKGQTVVEDALEGRPTRAALVDQQHDRLMQAMQHQLAQDAETQQGAGPRAGGV